MSWLGKYRMRLKEFAPTDAEVKKSQLPTMTIQNIVKYISKGNWTRAIGMGALSMAPQLDPLLTTDQKRVLHYAINTYGAADFAAGLSAFAARVGVPFLSLAGWSGKLNTGEEDELKARRVSQAERDFAP